MKDPDDERLWALCEQAANESDPEKVVAIAKEMNLLLQKKIQNRTNPPDQQKAG
jgi:hypothetical protein